MICNDCPRKCNIDRSNQRGFCNESENIRIAKIIPNFAWEEPYVSGSNGAFAIFFSGCNLKCSFCQNYVISRGGVGKEYSILEFVELLKQADSSDCECIDLITPTHFTSKIIECLKIYKPTKKIVWNSSGYENTEEIKKLSNIVDIFLPDFKYYSSELSLEKSKCKDYFEVASKAIQEMSKLKENIIINGVMQQGVIIRHLVLPEHCRDSFKILDFISENISKPIVSLMSQYTPSGEHKEGRRLNRLEYKSVLAHAKKLGLNQGFFQELDSSNEDFIPNF